MHSASDTLLQMVQEWAVDTHQHGETEREMTERGSGGVNNRRSGTFHKENYFLPEIKKLEREKYTHPDMQLK